MTEIVAGLCVLNEEDWIPIWYEATREFVDRIVFVEGAVKGVPYSTPDGHSLDSTISLIEGLQEKDDRIELITKIGPWVSKQKQQQQYLNRVAEGEWLFHTAPDEMYLDGDYAKLRALIESGRYAHIITPVNHFAWDLEHLSRTHNLWHQKLVRKTAGMRYLSHPTITDKRGMDSFWSTRNPVVLTASSKTDYFNFVHPDLLVSCKPQIKLAKEVWELEPFDDDIFLFHYGYLRPPRAILLKSLYYWRRDEHLGSGREALLKGIEELMKTWFWNGGFYRDGTKSWVPYDGPHPSAVLKSPLAKLKFGEKPTVLAEETLAKILGEDWDAQPIR